MENENEHTAPPFADNIFTLPGRDGTPPSLLGGYCQQCNRYFYPEPLYCPACLGQLKTKRVGSCGTVYSYTTVRAPSTVGLPVPYSIGYIDLSETGLRVLGLFDPDTMHTIDVGSRVRLSVKPLGMDRQGTAQLRPCFTAEPIEKR